MYFTNVSDIRPEEVHPFQKQRLSGTNKRVFIKEKSVFAPWKEDNPRLLASAFELDWENTRIPNIFKDKIDL